MDERRFSGAASLDEGASRRQTWLLAVLAVGGLGLAGLLVVRFGTETTRHTAPVAEPRRAPEVPITVNVPPPDRVLPSGLRLVEEHPGTGAPCQAGHTCTVTYRGFLWVGKRGALFDETGKRGPFRAKPEQLIRGFAEALERLRVGGKSTVIIPPELGYGSRGAGGKIPPGASLLFEIELVAAD